MSRADHHSPQFHLRLPRGYVNDPNGPIDIDGRAHLYFQSRPRVDLDIPVEWGHASSDDLVRWTLHRPAIVPVPGGADSGGVWSGNTVMHEGTVRAYYSGKVDHSPYQSVLLAESFDGGATFGPPRQVVDDPAPDEGVTMFRDPFVWRDGDTWAMGVGAAGADEMASIRLYRSDDGVTWERAADLAALRRSTIDGVDTGEGWECPQVLHADGTEIALVAAWSHAGGPGRVLAFALGEEPHPRPVDDGQNFYAAAVMRDGSWGPVVFGWITEGRSDDWSAQAGWSGAITLPRHMRLRSGLPASEPHPVVDSLRIGAPRPAHGATVGAQTEIVLPTAITGRIRLRYSAAEHLDVVVDAEAGTVAVDRSRSSADERADGGVAVARMAFDDSSGRPAVRVFVDGSVIEVFTSAGRVITTRAYPTQPPPWTIEAPEHALAWELECALGSETPARASAVAL
ncbi:MAG: glycoside hydrolase family 32 protein [Microbacteriaceae bacterium]